MLKDHAVPNDIYTFNGHPVDCFKQALEQAKKITAIDSDIKFEIVFDNQSNEVTVTFDRPNKIDGYIMLFGSGTVPGYLTEEDMSTIYNLANELPPEGVFVEVGSFLGKSTVEWAKSFGSLNKKYKIIAVDSYNSDIDVLRELLVKAEFDIPNSATHLEMFQHYTKDYPNIKPLQAFFNPDFVFDQKVAGVFEDSEHTQRALHYSLPYWWERILPGGILAGHDYTTVRDVQVSVDAFALLNDLEVHHGGPGGSIWWIKK
jgi:hypothetical protein